MSQPLIDRKSMTITEFAKRFGFSRSTASRLTSRPRDEYLAQVRDRHELIRALRREGLSYRAISRATGVSLGTVHNALRKSDGDTFERCHNDRSGSVS